MVHTPQKRPDPSGRTGHTRMRDDPRRAPYLKCGALECLRPARVTGRDAQGDFVWRCARHAALESLGDVRGLNELG